MYWPLRNDWNCPPGLWLLAVVCASARRRRPRDHSGAEDGIVHSRANRNTVNLGGEDGDAVLGGPGWLGPIAVLGALHGPVGHFAFDDAWVLARFARGERLGEDLGDRLIVCAVNPVGGKIPAGCVCCGVRRVGRG